MHDQAIEIMKSQGVEMTKDEEELALNLLPKVSLIFYLIIPLTRILY
jgi:hypothetical protein